MANFPTTRGSIVAALASGDDAVRLPAFDTLVSLYWRPLYMYSRIGRTRTREEAEDLTQSFFTRALESNSLAAFDAARASFRTFLRLLFDRHALNEWKALSRIKRGGAAAHLDFDAAEEEMARAAARNATPEEILEREWARSVFTVALDRLRDWAVENGKQQQLTIFESYDLQEGDDCSYRQLADRLGITETTVTNQLAAMRRRFRAIVLDLLREVTASEREFRNEARTLLGARVSQESLWHSHEVDF